MTISGTSSSYQSPAAAATERAMLVAKKQQDVSKDQGQALVALIENSSTGATNGGIDIYA